MNVFDDALEAPLFICRLLEDRWTSFWSGPDFRLSSLQELRCRMARYQTAGDFLAPGDIEVWPNLTFPSVRAAPVRDPSAPVSIDSSEERLRFLAPQVAEASLATRAQLMKLPGMEAVQVDHMDNLSVERHSTATKRVCRSCCRYSLSDSVSSDLASAASYR